MSNTPLQPISTSEAFCSRRMTGSACVTKPTGSPWAKYSASSSR